MCTPPPAIFHVFTDNTGSHSNISAFVYHDRIMPLILSVACKVNTVGDCNVAANFQKVITHIVQVAFHANEGIFSNLKTAQTVQKYTQIIKRTVGCQNLRNKFSDGFSNNR